MNNPSPGLPPGLERLVQSQVGAGFTVKPLTPDGSDRLYYRIAPVSGSSLIAVDGRGTGPRSRFVSPAGISQNQTFFRVQDHLAGLDFPVPRRLARDREGDFYLLEDLGDVNLCGVVGGAEPAEVEKLYRRVLLLLVRLQVEAAPGFDPAWAYAGGRYDRRVIRELELEYFLNAYLLGWAGRKLSSTAAGRLVEEFEQITEAALGAPADFFLYRDFQSRNLMVREGKIILIDFQGARLGPVYYDAAALIEDPYVELPRPLRRALVDFYRKELAARLGAAAPAQAEFSRFYDLFTLIRTLQTLGAFGWLSSRGKSHFTVSIPPALRNLATVLEALSPWLPLPELTRLCETLP